jgi:trk system potassium uptake protein TrkH
VYAFFVLYMGISAFGALAMSLLGLPFETAVTSVVATLNNIGPGLELVGAVRDYTAIPEAGKLLLTFLMAVGRLEVYTMMVLLLPSFWRHS